MSVKNMFNPYPRITGGERLAFDGNVYTLWQGVPSIAAGASVVLGWQVPTPTVKYYIFNTPQFNTDNTGNFSVSLNNAATFTGGSVLAARNRNYHSTNTADGQFVLSPTVTDGGVNQFTFNVNAASQIRDETSSVPTIINPLDQWVFTVTNLDASNAHSFTFYLTWSEFDS